MYHSPRTWTWIIFTIVTQITTNKPDYITTTPQNIRYEPHNSSLSEFPTKHWWLHQSQKVFDWLAKTTFERQSALDRTIQLALFAPSRNNSETAKASPNATTSRSNAKLSFASTQHRLSWPRNVSYHHIHPQPAITWIKIISDARLTCLFLTSKLLLPVFPPLSIEVIEQIRQFSSLLFICIQNSRCVSRLYLFYWCATVWFKYTRLITSLAHLTAARYNRCIELSACFFCLS